MCGGTIWRIPAKVVDKGLSPRVRGNHRAVCGQRGVPGSIPACAGEPHRQHSRARLDPVYPRVCGGTIRSLQNCPCMLGLSPRVRGNLSIWHGAYLCKRSIPACAGEPASCPSSSPSAWVYPRVCGGTIGGRGGRNGGRGLSPRVRGNPVVRLKGHLGIGSIPACAGEPPRICGWG